MSSCEMEQPKDTPSAPPEQQFGNRVLKVSGQPRGRVLIVEDEHELVEVLEFNLLRNGFEVLIAMDGLEACRIIGREKPDLILLDLLLPLLDGWEICRMVRSHQDPLVARTPIIMLSAHGSVDDRLKGYSLGADLYLPKPYAVKEVIVKAGQLAQQRHEYLNLSKKLTALQKWGELQDHWQQALFHELSNQLTMISGMAQHLKTREDIPRKRSEQFVEHIHTSSDYLGSLAMNYLLVRQVEKNPEQLRLQPVLPAELLAELKRLFRPQAEQRSCRIQLDCSNLPPVNLHPIGLKIILSTLLDNALKYAKSEGEVSLSARLDDRGLQIQVADNGPGIAPEQRGRVFEKFFRGENADSGIGGSGLGLYMAKTLSEALGGRLELLDRPQPGCCFQLSFPGLIVFPSVPLSAGG